MTQAIQAEPSAHQAVAHETLIAGLRNTHALEKQAIAVLEAQLKLFADYPDLHARVTDHIVETREQARRLEAALEACGGSTSMLKDTLLSAMGLGQSAAASFGDDAVLKAVTADVMQERLEVATYRTLLTLADLADKPEIRPRLEETLREEEAMAAWLEDNLDAITRRFVELKASEQESEAKDDAEQSEDGEPRTPWYAKEPVYTSVDDSKPGTHSGDAAMADPVEAAPPTNEPRPHP